MLNEIHNYLVDTISRVSNQGHLEQGSPPLNLSPPYAHHVMAKYEDDFPLRKTGKNSLILNFILLLINNRSLYLKET